MPIRALIVLLIVLNVGAAAWWISRPPLPLPPLPPQPAGVPRLRLLGEARPVAVAPETAASADAVVPAPTMPATPATAAAFAAADAATTPPVAAHCHRFGPFADQAAANAAAARMGSAADRKLAREVPGKAASGYNVLMPPSADRAAAQALAQRIGAAGFDDFLVVNTGEQANAVALGRYGSREAAERRSSALAAAGFAAQVQPVGDEAKAQWWLDVRATGATAAQLGTLAAAAQSRSLDCATLR